MTTNYEFYFREIWDKVIDEYKNRLGDNNYSYDMIEIFNNCGIYSIVDKVVKVRYKLFLEGQFLKSNKELIEDILSGILKFNVEIEPICINNNLINESDKLFNELFDNNLNSNYTFANFVIGKSNISAQNAALNVAGNPGLLYNPLFIYGKSGLGKTHILNAIGNAITNSTQFIDKKVGIISSTKFVEAVSKCRQNNTLDKLKECMYKLDVLLIDDIQFIAGKDKTHEIFFNIFNELVSNNKQIVLTADADPKDIKGLEARIISRFNSGLKLNIVSPGYETALKILKLKIKNRINDQYSIDEKALDYLATHFCNDVRELEGALNRLLFYSITFSTQESDTITIKECLECFRNDTKDNFSEITIKKIKKCVCDFYGLSKAEIEGKNRTKNIANARQIAMYLCRKLLDVPFTQIGKDFGNRDHSTVMSACDKVEKSLKTSNAHQMAISQIENNIRPNKLSTS